MGNPSDTKPDEPGKARTKESEDRFSEATSDKTVSDLEEAEKVSSSRGSDEKTPVPDGQFDEKRNENDEAGPM